MFVIFYILNIFFTKHHTFKVKILIAHMITHNRTGPRNPSMKWSKRVIQADPASSLWRDKQLDPQELIALRRKCIKLKYERERTLKILIPIFILSCSEILISKSELGTSSSLSPIYISSAHKLNYIPRRIRTRTYKYIYNDKTRVKRLRSKITL